MLTAVSDRADDIPPLPDYAIELEADHVRKALGKPPQKSTPEEGIARMEARITGLIAEIASLLAPDKNPDVEYVTAERVRIQAQLDDARKRLAEYNLQRDGKN
jgi:hypothetical protein